MLQCAQEHNINWKPIAECAASSEGDNLLKVHGDKTNDLMPRISFVPTILLDKVCVHSELLFANLGQ